VKADLIVFARSA